MARRSRFPVSEELNESGLKSVRLSGGHRALRVVLRGSRGL